MDRVSVFCSIMSSRRVPHWRRGYRDRQSGPGGDRMDRWSAMGWGELIDVGAWRGLADWVGRDGHRAAVPALARLLESELPAEPPLRELVKIRENLGWLDADALDVHGRVAFDTLVHFLDQAIEHGQACEGDPDRDSTVRFQWSHLKP